MLKKISPLLNGELLSILSSMGHGDEIAIVDANFPATACAKRLIEVPGVAAADMAAAICELLPLDDFVPNPAGVMEAPGDVPAIYAEFEALIEQAEGRRVSLDLIDRFAFYDRACKAFAVVSTGERRLYGNLILKKGVLRSA